MSKERRLGRGLEALLGRPAAMPAEPAEWLNEVPAAAPSVAAPAAGDPGTGLLQLSVQEIDANPFQPRRDFDEADIAELSASLQAHGLLQPIVVRRHGERWQLVAGERRLRAALQAGWTTVPAQVHDADDRQMAELAIVENLQRKDLNPLEKAASFHDYLSRYGGTQEELAGRLKIDRSTVANLIRLLELPEAVQDALRSGAISAGHARALLPLGDEQLQTEFCERIQSEGLSVRATEEHVHETITAEDSHPIETDTPSDKRPRSSGRGRGGQLAALEHELRVALGTKVELRQTASGRGKIVVHFATADEFERLREQLCTPAKRSQAS